MREPAARSPNSSRSATAAITTNIVDTSDEPGPRTHEAFVEEERLDWLDDKRPPAEFEPTPAYRVPETGTWIMASGQAAVANAMRLYCEGPPECEFAVMLGDNIYPDGATAGADGRDDAERFRKILYEPYAPLAKFADDFRIYVALGNHDWRTSREGAMAQVRYHEQTRPFYMDGIRYRVAPTGDPREVEIFVLDTHVHAVGRHRARRRARRRRQRTAHGRNRSPARLVSAPGRRRARHG